MEIFSGNAASKTIRTTGNRNKVQTAFAPNSLPANRKPRTGGSMLKIKAIAEILRGTKFPRIITRPDILPTDIWFDIRRKKIAAATITVAKVIMMNPLIVPHFSTKTKSSIHTLSYIYDPL